MIINIGTKEGKVYKMEIPKDKEAYFIHKKIGDVIEGDVIGLSGYTIQLTGGTDKSGFPMRYDVKGYVKKKILLSNRPGFRPKRKGERRRKTIRGTVYSEDTAQINAKVIKEGAKSLAEILGKKEEKKDAA